MPAPGRALFQWYLADQGAEVLSVDRRSRADLPLRFRRRFRVRGLRPEDLPAGLSRDAATQAARSREHEGQSDLPGARPAQHAASLRRSPGRVIIYNQDLTT